MTATALRIGQVAEATGLSEETLRYYEREGLLASVDRDASGHRRYTADAVAWVGLVTCMRDAGLGIADLREFTALLRSDGRETERSEFLRQRRAELATRADALAAAIGVLDEKIEHYAQTAD